MYKKAEQEHHSANMSKNSHLLITLVSSSV
jgi:hypothetical protein